MRCSVALVFLTGVLCVFGLASCGAGVPPGPNTQSIFIPVEHDGLVTESLFFPSDATGLSLSAISLGDDKENNTYRGLMRFPLASVPAGANVVGARLHVQFLEKIGTPGASLGHLEFQRLPGAPLSLADYAAPMIAQDPSTFLTSDHPNSTQLVAALYIVLTALGDADTHLKVRVQYQIPSDNDSILDQMRMGTLANGGAGAVLEIIVQP